MATRKKPKQYFYVCVVAKDNKFAFVTKIDSEKKTAEWTMKEGDKPLTIYSWDDANYIALGLQTHGTWAFPVVMSYELDTLPYYIKEN